VILRYGIDVVSGVFADEQGTIPVPARALQSAGLRLDVARGLRAAIDVRNLFDVRSSTYPGAAGPVELPIGDVYLYPLPGRSILASVRFSEGLP
jgi:outer membrane receptor protein involved in Fe transport